MDPRLLLLHLEHPLECYVGDVPATYIVMAGLNYDGSDYWPTLAVEWLEQGVEVDSDIQQALYRVSATKHFSQRLRYRSLAILRRKAK